MRCRVRCWLRWKQLYRRQGDTCCGPLLAALPSGMPGRATSAERDRCRAEEKPTMGWKAALLLRLGAVRGTPAAEGSDLAAQHAGGTPD